MPWISKDYTGQKFGKWTALYRDPLIKRPQKWICKCECGTEKSIFITNLIRRKSTQCIECQGKKWHLKDVGKKFHFLTLLDSYIENGKRIFLAKCDCGTVRTFSVNFSSGRYKSCGTCHLTKNNTNSINNKKGRKFGKLKVLDYDKKIRRYICRCDCGNIINATNQYFKAKIPSCGCSIRERNIENAKKLEKYSYFNKKILKFIKIGENKRSIYLIKCKCGVQFEQSISYIFESKSCGCLQKENVLKGESSPNSNLTETEAFAIIELFQSGLYTRKEIAEMIGCKYDNVCNIISGKTWKHIDLKNK